MIIDLHCHSNNSDDSLLSIDQIAVNSKEKGIDGICITDHEYFNNEKELNNISKKYDIKIFSGSEINTDIGHILVYGLNEYKFGMHRIEFLHKEVSKVNGAMIWAHPYRRIINENEKMNTTEFNNRINNTSKSEIINLINALETNNGRGTDFQNHFSKKLAEKCSLKMIGSSDCHLEKDIATWATKFESEKIETNKDLIHQIINGNYSPVIINNS